MAIFMKIDGVDGEHSIEGASGWIKLESLSWGLSRGASAVSAGLRSRAEPSISDVSCMKQSDGSSIGLLTEALTGSFSKQIDIQFMRQGTGRLLPYLVYALQDAGITSFQQSASADGIPMESFTLSFTSIQVTHTVFSDDFTGIPSTVLYSIPDAQ